MARRKVADSCRRLTASFPQDSYEEVQKLADQMKVSAAWIVREAVETYLLQISDQRVQRKPQLLRGGK